MISLFHLGDFYRSSRSFSGGVVWFFFRLIAPFWCWIISINHWELDPTNIIGLLRAGVPRGGGSLIFPNVL